MFPDVCVCVFCLAWFVFVFPENLKNTIETHRWFSVGVELHAFHTHAKRKVTMA